MFRRSVTLAAVALLAGSTFAGAQQMTDKPGISSDSPPFSLSDGNRTTGNFAGHTIHVGDYSVNDDWDCITTVNGVTYIGSDTGRLGARRELRRAGFNGPFACSHDGNS